MPVILEDWRYRQMDLSKTHLTVVRLANNEEAFRLYGRTVGHPTNRDGKYIYASPVVAFDAMTRTVKTVSGSEYRLGTCGGSEDEQLKHIQRDVMRNRKAAPVDGLKTQSKSGKSPESAASNLPPPADVNDTIINLDIDSDEDKVFGRVFGHDHDDRHIDAIIAKEMSAHEEAEAKYIDSDDVMKLPDRPIYDADPIEPD